MIPVIEHTEAAQAAEFAAAQSAERAIWAGFQWWSTSQGVDLMNVTRGKDGFGLIEQVGGLFGTHLARRAA